VTGSCYGIGWSVYTTIKYLQQSTSVKEQAGMLTQYSLSQNYPNPFNPTTTIEYQLPGTRKRFNVSLKIFDAIGREITHLVNETQEPGYYKKIFDASQCASGMYFYQLIATDEQNNKHVFKKKMVLIR
jgi:hypothetical protein